ncbi:MAG: serine/threonine protein kinase [Deltaproteobacteria bacterium]|nr:MAG: serine/threonine protein kinase [Deltaproteobacteria bacterium]
MAARSRSQASATPTRKIGSFEVERQLGHGGMGVVHLARQPALERSVVLKTLRRDLADDPKQEERFRREAQAAAAVHHQNVVAVYDCFAWRGELYIAQEYVDGADLSTVLGRVHRIEPHIAALIALEVMRGLEEIHARGIVHRDLKPSNILLGRRGEAKIADFGIALDRAGPALTQTGEALGTPQYMSPEQLLGERGDARSDLFSFGAVLYEMLTAQPPFTETDPDRDEALLRRIEAGRYRPIRRLAADTPRRLVRTIRACLRARPRRRPASAEAVRRSLERHLGGPSALDCRSEIAAWLRERGALEEVDGKTRMVAKPGPRRRRARRLRWAAAAAAGVALVAAPMLVELRSPGADALPAFRLPLGLGGETPARIRIDVEPWAEVRIDGGAPILTPQARPIEVAAGTHRIVFAHPELGSAERVLELAPGEQRFVTHVFTPGAAPPKRR